MTRRRASLLLSLLALLLCLGSAPAQERELLYSKSPSVKLQELTRQIQNPASAKIPYEQLSGETLFFVRIAPRQKIILEKGKLQEGAILGTRPFVFVTTPESLFGRPLLEIYEDIGYEAEDILHWQPDQEMVAIVYHYPKEIARSVVKDGQLPLNWTRQVYTPTWENIFALFQKLAEEAMKHPTKNDERPVFGSEAEAAFVMGFPVEGKQRVKTVGYRGLEATGGADWKYRQMLEQKLSIFEHFRGDGRTQNEVINKVALYEFVGPNMKLKDLPEVVVIYLGRLTIKETY
ncbi:MAG TPA: hypothetical protein VGB17_10775 [Pyrinomonadaceae bacterium]|jgi:hypothetical protein